MNNKVNKGSDVNGALLYLKENDIEAFEVDNILTIPVSKPEEIYDMATKARRLFKEIGFEKSWRIDPYYIEHHSGLREEMYGHTKGDLNNEFNEE